MKKAASRKSLINASGFEHSGSVTISGGREIERCQEETGQAPPREAVQGQEGEEDAGAVEALAGWEEPDQARGLVANAFAHHAAQQRLTRLGCHATNSNVPTAEPPW